MKKTISVVLALLLVVSLLAGCYKEQAPEVTSFEGAVTDVEDASITLKGSSITATFVLDSATEYVGGTTIVVGDDATIEYSGDITSGPIATKISFTQSAPEGSGTIEGVIVNATMSNVVITVADGNTYNFAIDDTTKIVAPEGEGILLGDDVTIVYVGGLEAWPAASSITVNNSAVIPHDSRDIQGTIGEIATDTFTLNIDSGHTYTFAYSASATVLKNCTAVKNGDQVKVTFTGDLAGTPQALVVTMIKEAATVPTGQKICGVCVAINGRVVTISVDSSHSYSFVTTTETNWTGDNLLLNSTLTITYTGYLGQNPVATDIYTVNQVSAPAKPVPTPTPAPALVPDPAPISNPIPQSVEKSISGRVTALSANNFTVQDDSGTSHTFNVNGDTQYNGTLENGARVNVNYMSVSNIALTITVVPSAAVVGITGPMMAR